MSATTWRNEQIGINVKRCPVDLDQPIPIVINFKTYLGSRSVCEAVVHRLSDRKSTMSTPLADKVNKALRVKGQTAAELAARIGVSPQAITTAISKGVTAGSIVKINGRPARYSRPKTSKEKGRSR